MANMMSQEELSDKYDVGLGIVSASLRGIPYVSERTPTSRRPVHVYDEKLALRAFVDYYDMRYTQKMQEAENYANKANGLADMLQNLSD